MSKKRDRLGNVLNRLFVLLVLVYLVSSVYSLQQINKNRKNQIRKFRVAGLLIDFKERQSLTIGGIPDENNDHKKLTGSRQRIVQPDTSDIWLFTRLLPSKIGTLIYDPTSEFVSLRLNQAVRGSDNSQEETKNLSDAIALPTVRNSNSSVIFGPDQVIPYNELIKGLRIDYPLGKSQRMTLQLKKFETGRFMLLIQPNPDHLNFKLEDYRDNGYEEVEFAYGKYQPGPADCNATTPFVYLPYNTRYDPADKVGRATLAFDNESIYESGSSLESIAEYQRIPGTGILLDFEDKIGGRVTFAHAFNILLFLYFMIRLALQLSVAEFAAVKIKKIFIGPIVLFAILYNVSMVLCTHYLFQTEHYIYQNTNYFEYFHRYIWSGVFLAGLLCFLTVKLSKAPIIFLLLAILTALVNQLFSFIIALLVAMALVKGLLIFLEKKKRSISFMGNWGRLEKWKHVILFIVFSAIYLILAKAAAGSGERFLGIIPQHSLARLITLSGYYFFATWLFRSFRKTRKKNTSASGVRLLSHRLLAIAYKVPVVLIVGFVICLGCYISGDIGFLIMNVISIAILAFLSGEQGFQRFSLLLLVLAIGYFGIMEKKLPNISHDRWKLAYNLDYADDASLANQDKRTTDEHRLILAASLQSNWQEPGKDLKVPNSLRTVIWTDYVLLYAMYYLGSIPFIALFVFFIVLLLFYFSLSVSVLFKIKKNNRFYPWLMGASFLQVSYLVQILFMLCAILRVVPLTGQSVPFLSFSWLEVVFFSSFLMLSYFIFYKKKTSNIREVERLGVKLWPSVMVSLAITAVIAGVGYVRFTSDPFSEVPSGIRNYEHKVNKTTRELFNSVFDRMRSESELTTWELVNGRSLAEVRAFIKEACQEVGCSAGVDKNLQIFLSELSEYYWRPGSKHIDKPQGKNKLIYAPIQYDQLNITGYISGLRRKPFDPDVFDLGVEDFVLTQSDSGIVLIAPNVDVNFNESIPGFKIRQAGYEPVSSDTLMSPLSSIYTRKINGIRQLYYCQSSALGHLALSMAMVGQLRHYGLSIDPLLQSVVYGGLHGFGRENKIDAGAIVVIENKSGKIKAMTSYPLLKPNASQAEQGGYIGDLKEKMFIYPSSPNVALSGAHPASTWKMIQASAAAITDPGYFDDRFQCFGNANSMVSINCNNHTPGIIDMETYLSKSCNHYSEQLLSKIMSNPEDAESFEKVLEDYFDIYFNITSSNKEGRRRNPGQLIASPAKTGDLGNITERQLASSSIGMQDMNMPLTTITQSLARIITRKKVYLTLLDQDFSGNFIDFNENATLDTIKHYLAQTSITGTARGLKSTEDPGLFDSSVTVYAKTGTADKNEENLIIFGTERYSFGIYVNNSKESLDQTNTPGRALHASSLAVGLLPYIKELASEYLED